MPSSFILHVLNKVCGTEDADYLHVFRFFINDLHNQLDKLSRERSESDKEHIEKVYRGKYLACSILQNLIDNEGELISFNDFLSTTKDKDVAMIYAGTGATRPGPEPVLFELHIDRTIITKPFLKLTPKETKVPAEAEVLFSIGTVWRIKKVVKPPEGNNIWLIVLEPSKYQDPNASELTDFLKQEIPQTSTLLTLGIFLTKIGQAVKAEKYYRMLLNELQTKHEDYGYVCNQLGCLLYDKKDYSVAKDYFEKAVACTKGTKTETYVVAKINHKLVQLDSQYCPTLLDDQLGTLEVTLKSLSSEHADLQTAILNNIGGVYHQLGNHPKAINSYEKARDLLKETKPVDLGSLSVVYNNLGAAEYIKGHSYTEALKYFTLAHDSGVMVWGSSNPLIKDYLQNMATTQGKLENKPKRLKTKKNDNSFI
ncbi:unnamed protein product [Didymodactylos carnosus]|uniref:Tetratricopeptide repeat protein n=1 Tax=Didymodactylos carnosus TaxID=1234261 RepID=A0A815KNU4_9BILA|nr:unnamed protein product [Didymodactylos carnosus]CAF4286743.1 unnamed protein product [Didymodactylos carnosus]